MAVLRDYYDIPDKIKTIPMTRPFIPTSKDLGVNKDKKKVLPAKLGEGAILLNLILGYFSANSEIPPWNPETDKVQIVPW